MRNIPSPMSIARTVNPGVGGTHKKSQSMIPQFGGFGHATTPQPSQSIPAFSLPVINATERKQLHGANFDKIYIKKNEELESLVD